MPAPVDKRDESTKRFRAGVASAGNLAIEEADKLGSAHAVGASFLRLAGRLAVAFAQLED